VQNRLTAFKVGFILLFCLAGLCFGAGDPARLADVFRGGELSIDAADFAVALIFVSFAYSGWNAAAYLGGEIRRPERNLPLALISGVILVTVLYLLLNLVYLYALPVKSLSGMLELGTGSATALFGIALGKAAGIAIALGLLSVVSAMIMAGPRVYFAMACDGLFFRRFGCVDAGRNTPGRAIAFQGAIAIAMIISATFDTLLIYIGFTLSLAAMLTVAGLIKLRITEPGLSRPYRTLGYPFTPLLFIAGNLWIVIYSLLSRPVVALYGIGTILAGVCFYWMFRPPVQRERQKGPHPADQNPEAAGPG
jgi:APA family basic amino acid/polyamine antiporter